MAILVTLNVVYNRMGVRAIYQTIPGGRSTEKKGKSLSFAYDELKLYGACMRVCV